MKDSLREWLQKVEQSGELRRVEGADWDLEIGTATALNEKRQGGPALLFDNIAGYPSGYRVLTSSTLTRKRLALTLNLPEKDSDLEFSHLLRQKLVEWESKIEEFQPVVVSNGPLLENVHSGANVDLFRFPVPRWNTLDGARYIGTADAVITKDLDTGEVNLGTYRVAVHDRKNIGIMIVPGHHGRAHYEKYHARRQPCPIAISVGHHPLIFRIACTELPPGAEYALIGAIQGEPVEVIREEITGLPVPANSEIVIVGWIQPGKSKVEGPFGEWTGYYASKERPAPLIEVERIYHRNSPIILGSHMFRPPDEGTYYKQLLRSAIIHNDLVKNGVPEVKGVWISDAGGPMLIIISLKQQYAGHAKQAALFATQSWTVDLGRYVIVVDEDIDPSNMHDVLWALCTRSDPEKDIDIIRQARSTPLDPMIRKPATSFANSRAIINACKPYEWKDEFPQSIHLDSTMVDRVRKKWPGYF